MKKYAIIIGENNEDLSRKVQEALFAVGIKWDGGQQVGSLLGRDLLGVNYYESYSSLVSLVPYGDMNFGGWEFVSASCVLEHAAELDGAKKPWEVPPEGMRLVTDAERKEYKHPKDVMFYTWDNDSPWGSSCAGSDWKNTGMSRSFAVPTDYVFSKPVKKMTVAEVCGELGYDVEIVK